MKQKSANRQSLFSRIMNPKYIMVYATVVIFLIIYAVGAILYGDIGFTTLRTFVNFFTDNAYYGISAVGMTMVLITGGIDLSVASVLLKSVIPAIINFNGTLSSWWGKIATGALLLLFIVIQRAVVSYTGKKKAG